MGRPRKDRAKGRARCSNILRRRSLINSKSFPFSGPSNVLEQHIKRCSLASLAIDRWREGRIIARRYRTIAFTFPRTVKLTVILLIHLIGTPNTLEL